MLVRAPSFLSTGPRDYPSNRGGCLEGRSGCDYRAVTTIRSGVGTGFKIRFRISWKNWEDLRSNESVFFSLFNWIVLCKTKYPISYPLDRRHVFVVNGLHFFFFFFFFLSFKRENKIFQSRWNVHSIQENIAFDSL